MQCCSDISWQHESKGNSKELTDGLGFCWVQIFDCPGQIELYSHVPVLRTFVDQLKQWDFRICAVYLMDSQVGKARPQPEGRVKGGSPESLAEQERGSTGLSPF